MPPSLLQPSNDYILSADRVAFARALGIEPDDWQRRFLQSTAQQVILNISRQAGKSTVTSILGLHTAVYDPGSLTLVLSPSERQSSEFMRKAKESLDTLGRVAVGVEEESALRLELATGSRIIALPGKEATVRGYSGVKLLIIDEASKVMDDLYYTVRPMLAVSGGRIVLLSTPFGKRGFFHHEWEHGGDVWERFEVDAYQCPRMTREWLDAERRQIGEWWFAQEYLCKFLDTTDQVFGSLYVDAAMDQGLQPLFGGAT